MSRYKTLVKNSLIFVLSSFASRILIFFMLPLYTRVLTREEFGTADLIILTISLMSPLFTLSISESALRFTLDEDEDSKQVFMFGLKLIAGSFVVIIALLPMFLRINIIKDYVLILYLIYIAQTLNQYFNRFIRGINKIFLIGIVGIIQTITTVISNIVLLVIFKFGISGFLLSIFLANTIALFILFIAGGLRHYLVFNKIDKSIKRKMLRYCIPLTPNRLSWWLNNYSNKYIISGFAGISELGLFSAASRVPTILISFQSIFIQAWQLSALQEYDKKDSVRFFSTIYNLYNFLMLICCSILILFIRPVSHFLFGNEFSSAWRLVPFLLVGVVFGALTGFLNSINLAFKKTKSIFVAVLIGACVAITLNFIFIPVYGAIAAAITTSFSFFLIWLIRLFQAMKFMRLGIFYMRDSISYAILVFQSIITTFQFNSHTFLFSAASTFMLLIINQKTVVKASGFVCSRGKDLLRNNGSIKSLVKSIF